MVFLLSCNELVRIDFLKRIIELNKITPGVWYIAANIINDKRYTLIIDRTIIISVYELSEIKLIILYKTLKQISKSNAILKVINKKEFLLVKVIDQSIIRCFENLHLWKLIELGGILDSYYSNVTSKLLEDSLICIVNGYELIFKIHNDFSIICLVNNTKLEYIIEYYYQESLFLEEILNKLSFIEK